jgi:hypothetical protein
MAMSRWVKATSLVLAVLPFAVGCMTTTRVLIVDTGKVREEYRLVSDAWMLGTQVYAGCECVRVECGVPALELDMGDAHAREKRTGFQGVVVWDLSNGIANNLECFVPCVRLEDASQTPGAGTADANESVRSVRVVTEDRLWHLSTPDDPSTVLQYVPDDDAVYVIQAPLTSQTRWLYLARRTADGCDIYPLKSGDPHRQTNTVARCWKIPCFLPVALAWDVVNSVVTPPLFLVALYTVDWIPH